SDHDEIAIAALTPGVAEGVGFAVHGRVAMLHAPVVAGSKQAAVDIKDGRADRDATFRQALARFSECDSQHGCVIHPSPRKPLTSIVSPARAQCRLWPAATDSERVLQERGN